MKTFPREKDKPKPAVEIQAFLSQRRADAEKWIIESRINEQRHFINTGLQPGDGRRNLSNRFNGFPRAGKPLKRLAGRRAANTRLKPGVNEKRGRVAHF
jgi:hypothetical protein